MEQSGGRRSNDEAEHGQRRKSDGKEFSHGGTVSRKAGANGPGHYPGGGRAPMIHVNYTRRAGTDNPCGCVFSRRADDASSHQGYEKRDRQNGQEVDRIAI
jgi:hypothetical protein